ncbi:MAG: hypothetical protein MI922_08645 [Bacteroidales bacterium]|nr:hypothetical protein [Bacteroidales bacterium]
MKLKYLAYLSSLILLLVQCDIKKSDLANNEGFSRIFHDNDGSKSYHPLDLMELDDGSLLILAALKSSDSVTADWNQQIPYVIKTTPEGTVEWTATSGSPYVSPVGNLLHTNNEYYFFCTHAIDQGAYLMRIDIINQAIEPLTGTVYGDNAYVVSANTDGSGNILMQSVSKRGTKNSQLYKISGSSLQPIWSAPTQFVNAATGGTDFVIPVVLEELAHNGNQYPFSIKEISNASNQPATYVVNAFKALQLSMNYVDANSGEATGGITGSFGKVFISSFQHVKDSLIAVTRNDNGQISFLNDMNINSQNYIGVDEIGNTAVNRELDGESLVLAEIIPIDGTDYLVYAAATKGERIMLLVYKAEDISLQFLKYLGSTNNIEPISLRQANDGALLLLCKTLVTNRYPRITMYKIPVSELGF